jgi:arabinose operon protein AraL
MNGYIFDLDGTIYLGDELIEGVDQAIETLKREGHKVAYLTNKSISKRIDYQSKLKKMGINAELDEIITSSFISGLYLREQIKAGGKVLVIGETSLIEEMEDAGISITHNIDEAEYVLIGWDRNFNYSKINTAFQAWKRGAKLIATNPDKTCPIKGGEVPDCAAMIGAIENVIEGKIQVIGKPSQLMLDYVVKKVFKLKHGDCYMVGDRLETDIKMANDTGVNSVLVMTGITNEMILGKSIDKPKYILDSVKSIGTLKV